MTRATKRPIADIEQLAHDALAAHGASNEGARSIARAIALAEASGNRVCGLFYVGKICEQLEKGLVKGNAEPRLIETGQPGRLVIDAGLGFAHTAFDLGLPLLVAAVKAQGCATLALRHSYNALDLGQFAERIAEAGLIGLVTSNSPAAVAHPGASKKLFGTNPFAYAVPGPKGPSVIVDMSTSAMTKTAIIFRAEAGEPLEPGWAVDNHGQPTTDAKRALEGAILPFGGQKGAAISLLVEILAAALTGSSLSKDAGMFSGETDRPADVGQLFIALDPGGPVGAGFHDRMASLGAAVEDAGAQLPGKGRLARRAKAARSGVEVPDEMWAKVAKLAGRKTG